MNTPASFRALLSVVTALVALAAGPVAANATQPREELQSALKRVVEAGAPGAVAFAGGRTVAVGVANVESRRALRPRDRMRIGSITKSFVATVALQLVGEGRLRLGDTVGELLPGVLPAADRVTLRQLLNHTSGVPDDVPAVVAEIFHGDPLRVWTRRELVGLAGDGGLSFKPGSDWAYSNTNYVLAGLMIERATGHRLHDELARRIVRPLGLRHTSFPNRDPELGRHASRGYSLDVGPNGPVDGPLRDITRYSPSFGWASANGISTVGDIARFYRGLLRGRLLPPRLLRKMITTVPTGRPGRRWGLGLNVSRTAHGVLVGHDGEVPGFDVHALSTRDGRRQAVVAVNAMFAPPAVDDRLDAARDAAVAAALAR